MKRLRLEDVSQENQPGPARFALSVKVDASRTVVQFANEWPGDEAGSICLDLPNVRQLIRYLQHVEAELAVKKRGQP